MTSLSDKARRIGVDLESLPRLISKCKENLRELTIFFSPGKFPVNESLQKRESLGDTGRNAGERWTGTEPVRKRRASMG
uniref:Uncharacterized protein n=1 Tax=Rhizophora mucronata TaxID=61149 RepID=A0A2P2Q4I1_RHIMU